MNITIKNLSIAETFRLATKTAVDNGNNKVNCWGVGRCNAVIDALGFPCVVECYPKGECDKVHIYINKNGATEVIALDKLPVFLQIDVLERYCKELGVEIEIDDNY